MTENSIKSHPFPWDYFAIAFAFSWIVWLPGVLAARGLFTLPMPELVLAGIGGFGPFVSAFYLTRRRQGKKGVKALIKRALNFRIPLKWLAAIFVIHLAVTAAARHIYIWRGGELPDSPVLGSPVAILVLFLVLFFFGGSVNEEFGWRGYALDRIQSKHSALLSSIILGFLWGLWHLPLFFFRGLSQSYMSFWIFLGWTCSLAVLMTWFHNNNKGNILVALLFHTMGNLSGSIFPYFNAVKGADQTPLLLTTAMYSIVAIIVVLIAGPKKLSRKPDSEMPFRNLDLR
ncbi:MAG: CPBP family intramembrane metalloprotease [Candidatus Aminicenantes bacterium]|nr:CPBP family intramembrane metalloprotease [Candidatus Aminicenantes bacterium]